MHTHTHKYMFVLYEYPHVLPTHITQTTHMYTPTQYLTHTLICTHSTFSTRPFLTVMEKKWIVFQLLKVLEECHDKRISHGDIKTENVLLTSWGWVLLTDFASFKPTILPNVRLTLHHSNK